MFYQRNEAHVSGRVDTPLISHGKLLRQGWGIVPEPGGKSFLAHTSGAKVEVSFKQNSLLVSGTVRMISEAVSVINGDAPRNWRNLKNGWYSIKQKMVFLRVHPMVETLWMFWEITRSMNGLTEPDTTTLMDGRCWNFVKACFSLMNVLHQSQEVTGNF